MTLLTASAIPKASAKRELQRLVRLPRIEFSTPLVFDRASGFVVFPQASSGAREAAALLQDAKDRPEDADLFLQAGRIYARCGDIPNSIRSYARAADLFNRGAELDPGDAGAFIGLADACTGLGRFAEAQVALDNAARLARDNADFASARFWKEKAWTTLAGEETRFSTSSFVNQLETLVRRGGSANRLETSRHELGAASERFARLSGKMESNREFLLARAAFRSFRAAMETAFTQIQRGEKSVRELRRSILNEEALADLARAVALDPEEPETIAAAMFATAYWNLEGAAEPALQPGRRDSREVFETCRRLERIANSGSRRASEAAELLACAQIFLIKDYLGAERTIRSALRTDPARESAWDLLVLTLAGCGANADWVEACEERAAAIPNARSSAILVKSYDRQGDTLRAEWNALLGAASYPHDLEVNLSLAAILMKREDVSEVLWRVGDALNKAEKQISISTSPRNQLDFVLLKGIYLGLSDQVPEARALLRPYSSHGSAPPEIQELLQALEF